jgi:hypothetical protein
VRFIISLGIFVDLSNSDVIKFIVDFSAIVHRDSCTYYFSVFGFGFYFCLSFLLSLISNYPNLFYIDIVIFHISQTFSCLRLRVCCIINQSVSRSFYISNNISTPRRLSYYKHANKNIILILQSANTKLTIFDFSGTR